MKRGKNRFTKAEKAEIAELYLGNYGSVRELAKLFGVSNMVMRYFVNHNDCRKFHTEYGNKWRKEHPERAKELQRKASNKWKKNNPEKVRERCRIYYARHREEKREYYRARYWKKKLEQ